MSNMLILNQRESAIIESSAYHCYAIVQDQHGYMIGAFVSGRNEDPVRLGWYCEKEEASEVLLELFDALNRNEDSFCFPQQYETIKYRYENDAKGYVY